MNSHPPLLSVRAKDSSHSKTQGDPKAGPGQLYLRIKIPAVAPGATQALLIAMDSIQEVLSLPVQRLSPMPGMPSPVLGLMNRGNRVFWLADLAQLIGLSQLEPNRQQHNVLILRDGTSALGLAVAEVQPMLWVADQQLQSDLTAVNARQKSLISHWVKQDDTLFWRIKISSLLKSKPLNQMGLMS